MARHVHRRSGAVGQALDAAPIPIPSPRELFASVMMAAYGPIGSPPPLSCVDGAMSRCRPRHAGKKFTPWWAEIGGQMLVMDSVVQAAISWDGAWWIFIRGHCSRKTEAAAGNLTDDLGIALVLRL
jgi:hypothetical protein